MKFICSQSDLNTNLSLVSRAVPSRPTHPILANVLFVADAEKQQVSLTGFDLSLGIRTSFPAQVISPGTSSLPAKLLNDIVSRLREGEITIVDEEETLGGGILATIISASGRFQVRGMDATEYPELPIVEDGEALTLPIEALSEGLKLTLFAASSDETKQILTGIHLTFDGDNFEFAATNGHRLAVVQTTNEPESEEENESSLSEIEDFEITIPARALRELERIFALQDKTDLIALNIDESQVVFELGDRRLTSRKLEGQYPNYQQLIPNQFSIQLTLDRRRLVSSLELVSVLADQKNNIVKFSLDSDKQQLALSVDAKDVGSAKEVMSVEMSGDNIEIGFNTKYLLDGLKSLPSNEITMQLNSPTTPVIFTPLGGLKMTYLVMPVQLRD
ncbi:DNA polymerase III subunit beta [Oscillatoria salina]|uniref:DNA polymerase III subunit beta n=1 Tax=Oscillatoria salina TaxID=331517 RepID=UPI0013B81D1E|nr:DNA polymerase III subunit beta [Oscillatoria salina]MBZ8178989.1 DNA polymerase III subunit beta [Oscillatoria salina IIICB1]NET88161.1 DNA polymerase III subunit beta [Kamptonema sp. SIO1D9]